MMIIHKIENRLNEEKYAAKYIKQLQKTIDRIDKEVMQLFARANKDGKWSKKELAKYNRKLRLREQIRNEIKKYKTAFILDMRNDLEKLYKGESLFTQRLLRNIPRLGITNQFNTLPVQAIKSQVVDVIQIKGKTMADYITKYSTDLTFRIEQEIFESIALGENPRKITRRLNDIYGTMAKHRVDMTTRSWTNAIYNQSNIDVYQQADLKKVRLLATLDIRTCPICAVDHNKVFVIGEQPLLPRHPDCRCCYSPHISDKLTGPATSYENWLMDGRRTPEQLETVLNNVNSYMKRGLIKKKEGEHLQNIIEDVLTELNDIKIFGCGFSNKEFAKLLPGADKKTLQGLKKAHNEALKYGLKTNNENLIAISKDTGEKAYILTSNKEDEVEFTPKFVKYLKKAETDSIILVHNHPGSSSFSDADLNILNHFNSIYALTVEGHDGTKYMCCIGNGKKARNYQEIRKMYIQYKNKHFNYYNQKVINGQLSPEEAWKEHSHEIISDIAKKLGWEYRRIIP